MLHRRLCRYLTEMNIRKPDGSNFPNTSINRIIKNPIYTGVIRNGEAQSDVIPELQIIDPEIFERAQKIMADRTTHHAETPLNLKGQSGYGVKKLDGIVEQIVRYQLSRISAASGAEIVAKQNEKAIELAKARYNVASTQLADKQKELAPDRFHWHTVPHHSTTRPRPHRRTGSPIPPQGHSPQSIGTNARW